MNRDDELQDRLRRLTRAVPQEASQAVEQVLRAEFRLRKRRSRRVWMYVGEIAAMLLLAGGLYLAFSHRGATVEHDTDAAPAKRGSDFIALPYAQSDVPLEQPVIVRMKVSVSELDELGVPLRLTPKGDRVSADLLVGQDGVARAVRIVE